MIWDDASIEVLKQMRADGDSASQIAAFFGCTRNVICGKMHRMGLPAPAQAVNPAKQTAAQQKALIRNRQRMRRYRATLLENIKIQDTPLPFKTQEPKPKGDVSTGCRFLRGEAVERNFCGAPGTPWCDHHKAVVFNRAPTPRARVSHWRYLNRAQEMADFLTKGERVPGAA